MKYVLLYFVLAECDRKLKRKELILSLMKENYIQFTTDCMSPEPLLLPEKDPTPSL